MVMTVFVKIFRPTNEKHSNNETLSSPAGSLSTLIATFYSNSSRELFCIKRDETNCKIPHNDIQWERAAEHGVTSIIRYYAKKFPDLALKETSVHITAIARYITALSCSRRHMEEAIHQSFLPQII